MSDPLAMLPDGRPIEGHRPWPRIAVDEAGWRGVCDLLADARLSLSSLWADGNTVHMAVSGEASPAIAVVSLACPEGRFPSVGAAHAPAIRLERAIHDLHGLQADGAPDARPWLDHGRWGVCHPLGAAETADGVPPAYEFLPVEGEGLHRIPVGPIHAGIIEPGHFRFTANGEAVVRLEARLGYVHRGVDAAMRGSDIRRGAAIAGRVSGDSTLAYALAFSRAVEAALGVETPARAHWLRALMAELERIANHLGDIGAICNDASFLLMHAHTGVLREHVLRAAEACFGHRLMRDLVIPGGVAVDLVPQAFLTLAGLVGEIRPKLAALTNLYDSTTSLQDRTVSTGILEPALARRFAAGGYVGRGSGRDFDTRRDMAYPPYGSLSFDVPVLTEGDVNARVWIRIREVEQSLGLVEQILAHLPDGPVRADVAAAGPGEGMALVEGFRGDILAWVRLDAAGRIARCHLRDPSWFQWPLLEAAIEGNIVADFPLCNKSFNCSYAGVDL